MTNRNHHLKAAEILGPPPVDALVRLRFRTAQSHIKAQTGYQPTEKRGATPQIIPAVGKQRRGRKRGTPASLNRGGKNSDERAPSEPKEERIGIEAWVPPTAANQLQAVARAHGLLPGTLIHLLARGSARLKPGSSYPATFEPLTKPWHVRWTICQTEFAELDSSAESAGHSVGAYCVAKALLALNGSSTASVAPLLLTHAEREIVARLHKFISFYSMIIELKSGPDKTIAKLRQVAEFMVSSGPSASDGACVDELTCLAGMLAVRAKFGAQLTDVQRQIGHVVAKFTSQGL